MGLAVRDIDTEADHQIGFGELRYFIRSHLLLIGMCLVIGIGAGSAWVRLSTPIFAARARLLLEGQRVFLQTGGILTPQLTLDFLRWKTRSR